MLKKWFVQSKLGTNLHQSLGIRRLAAASPDAAGFLTTVKDLVKLPEGEIAGRPVWGVKTELDFLGGESFFDKALGWK